MKHNIDIKKLFGAKLALLRKNAGFSQDTFSEKLGVTPHSLSSVERGQSFPRIETIKAISEILNVELSDLFSFDDKYANVYNNILSQLEAIKKDKIKLISIYEHILGLM